MLSKQALAQLPLSRGRLNQLVESLKASPRLALHLGVIAAVSAVVALGGMNIADSPVQTASGRQQALASVVDSTASAYIAADVARQLELPVARKVVNYAQQLSTQATTITNNSQYLSKPQVIDNTSRNGIMVYNVVEGDTVASVAQKFDVTSETIAWANGISLDAELLGSQQLRILPVSGLMHTLAEGDTPVSLAKDYQANAAQIIAFNNLSLSDFKPGLRIIIPDGVKPAVTTAVLVADEVITPRFNGGSVAGNGYDYGYCTWYVKNKRSDIPNSLGNAIAWKYNAVLAGFKTGSKPAVGAVGQEKAIGGLGHVVYVEEVHSNGTVTVSEMNRAGWGVVSRRTVPASAFDYIY